MHIFAYPPLFFCDDRALPTLCVENTIRDEIIGINGDFPRIDDRCSADRFIAYYVGVPMKDGTKFGAFCSMLSKLRIMSEKVALIIYNDFSEFTLKPCECGILLCCEAHGMLVSIVIAPHSKSGNFYVGKSFDNIWGTIITETEYVTDVPL